METIHIDGHSLTLEDIIKVAYRRDVEIKIKEEAKEKIYRARALVEKSVAEHKIIYGLTTGFGQFKNVVIK